ncbi:MAG: hypothetical protein HGA87_00875 [Desulfobulbaceae bacterium]|nr:hypothetical protein [Desulfobulbaceae bacterium]
MEQREIKFRAWDTSKNAWYEPVYEAYRGHLYELSMTIHGRLNRRTIDPIRMENIIDDESCFMGRYNIMQYTGLHDKNGKEIYEGDVVRFGAVDDHIATVVFSDGAWRTPHGGGNYRLHGWSLPVTIIGNIYENPELLERK